MARIAGVDLPRDKRIVISLQYIYGIGNKTAHDICAKANVDPTPATKDLTEDEIRKIREIIEADYKVEGDLRREVHDEHQAADGPRLLPRACATARACRSAGSAPTPTPAPARARKGGIIRAKAITPPRGPDRPAPEDLKAHG